MSELMRRIHWLLALPRGQAWYWTKEHQEQVRESEADVASGNVRRYDSPDKLLADLFPPSSGGIDGPSHTSSR